MNITIYDDGDILAMYIDWFNNFLTLPHFAEYYGIDESFANYIIKEGRKILNRQLYGGTKLNQRIEVKII